MAEDEQTKSLFGNKDEPKGNYQEIILGLNTLGRSLKVIEDKLSNARNKLQITDQNLVSLGKKVSDDTKIVNSELTEMKRDIEDIKEKMRLIIKELKVCAKQEEIQVLTKYLNLWDPLQFVTRNEIEKIIKEILEKTKDTDQRISSRSKVME